MHPLAQWETADGECFRPVGPTQAALPPGVYEVLERDPITFRRIPSRTDGLVSFPGSASQVAVEDIRRFWEARALYRRYQLAFRRGLLLWGPQGSGKSSTIRLIIAEVVEAGGIAVRFCVPYYLMQGLRAFRRVQADTPCVLLMEDLDALIKLYDESAVLNILDGVEKLEGMVFLATTNHPELLEERVLNRPSRFDRRIEVGMLDDAARELYLLSVINGYEAGIDLSAWVRDTAGLSVAHLKELFIAVVIYSSDYRETLARLRGMGGRISMGEGNRKVGGFRELVS
jgi:ATPase family associated with various cellular activities (AAA)